MTKKFLVCSAMLALVAAQAQANTVSFSQSSRKVTAAEAGGNAGTGGAAPTNGDVYTFRVTTDSDIVSVNQVAITFSQGGPLFNNTFGDGSNAAPPNPALVGAFPSLGADSYIDTPGTPTSRLGADLPGDGATTFGDLTNDGAQSNFVFAQLTVPFGTVGKFNGRISIADTTSPGNAFVVPFSLDIGIPEPSTMVMAGLGLIGAVALRRRQK